MSSETRTSATVKQVHVLGMNEFNRAKLEALPALTATGFMVCLRRTRSYTPTISPLTPCSAAPRHSCARPSRLRMPWWAIWIFPVSTILPILTGRLELPGLDLLAMLKCEHKYWSRLEQQAVVPDAIPEFQLVDPFLDSPENQLELEYPFWLKPVKSAGSYLGFRIDDEAAFHRAIIEIREQIHRIAEPFDRILEYVELPENIAAVGGHFCLAESLLTGDMCALWKATCTRARSMCTAWLIRCVKPTPRPSPAISTPPRCRAPSRTEWRMWPGKPCSASASMAPRLTSNSSGSAAATPSACWKSTPASPSTTATCSTRSTASPTTRLRWSLPWVTTRSSRPRAGASAHAAAFWLRRHEDAWVADVPSAQTLEAIARDYPGTYVELDVHPGMWLSRLHDQDSYSYVLALIYVGADTHEQLMSHHGAIVEA